MEGVAGAIFSGFLLPQIADLPCHKIVNTFSDLLGPVFCVMAKGEAESQTEDRPKGL